MVKVLGFAIDFADLRSEPTTKSRASPVYNSVSGRDAEDAIRCDALFYNLDTRLVEDFTNKDYLICLHASSEHL